MNKTVYLRDEEVPVWEKARELSEDRLSPVIITALRRFIKETESGKQGFERIVVEYKDSEEFDLPKKKAFYGRWIIPPDKPFEAYSGHGDTAYYGSVAETAKGSVVVVEKKEGLLTDTKCKFRVYPTFQDAVADSEFRYVVREAFERRGVPVDELDI